MDKRLFWATKSTGAVYHAIVFEHPAFEAPFRLVANQFAEVELGGYVHMPAPMSIKPPEQKGSGLPRLTMMFPRQVVGRQFKQQLSRIAASGLRDPIVTTYSVYLGDTDAPELVWRLFVSDAAGVAFNSETVQVTATEDNLMRRSVARIYDPSVFTGLERI